MQSLDRRHTDVSVLHPVFRDAVLKLIDDLKDGNHPFELFESFRSPERQEYLFSKGRSAPGSIVTNARPWSSYHQYGLAADFVLKINGQWSWDTQGINVVHWKALHELGRRHGLEPLSWEMPHLQLAGLRIEDLRAGRYPPFGDDNWAENLETAIEGWAGAGAVPPRPAVPERPALDGVGASRVTSGIGVDSLDLDASTAGDGALNRSAVPDPTAEIHAMLPNQFARIQTYIDKWEGGYVDHPSDPGGATNMGITLATLSRWRGGAVSKAELKALTRVEQRLIMKAFYYDVVRGDEMPAAAAAMTYNAAVLHGPSRGARFLQAALVAQGLQVAVDGAVGRQTLGAAARADLPRLVADFASIQERFLRSLHHFSTFGKGWMNRLEDITAFARTFLSVPSAASILNPDFTRPSPVVDPPPPDNGQPLTSVNAALGQTVGRLLDGRKTAIGLVATLLTAVAPSWATSLGLPPIDEHTVTSWASAIQPFAVALTGWGFLGKLQKWLVADGQATPAAGGR
ncbi:peptidoglycan L-alanyl-D-glutamate endopeptidase CwlK [Inquilinus ginsengisoli]|uniref:glycosyl hydrolase 108 family protein n=1 Tax=Inquilinus ginsengisoli TaxID=363840 RepID=UPI003D250D7A